jgi:hypothetical protein
VTESTAAARVAAPIVLDLALFLDLAQRCGMKGVQEFSCVSSVGPVVCERADVAAETIAITTKHVVRNVFMIGAKVDVAYGCLVAHVKPNTSTLRSRRLKKSTQLTDVTAETNRACPMQVLF